MERNQGIFNRILISFVCILTFNGCFQKEKIVGYADIEFIFKCPVALSKAIIPDEDKISDVSLMIFNENGSLEIAEYIDQATEACTIRLNKGMKYSILACANFGYHTVINNIEEKASIDFHLAYPDEFQNGLPMTSYMEGIMIETDSVIEVEMERMVARISLKMDRSRLADGVRMDVTGVRIGNCPRKMSAFAPNKVMNEDECFIIGFSHDDIGCTPLNTEDTKGISEELSVYMLENLQGRYGSEDILDEDDKVFLEKDPRRNVCSYIEIELEYTYGDMASMEQPLIYRFYLGEDLNSLDIERNCHYHITICPEDDGLHGDGWRVDKSGIKFTGKPELIQYPDDYITGNIGDKIHIGCIVTPPETPFNIGLDYLAADKAEGIYDYEIDEDGHGVTLTLTGPGRGLVYMEAGEPVNDAALFLIEVNLP